MLRSIELSLRTLRSSDTDTISPVLTEVERIKDGASELVEELDAAVKKTLKDNDDQEACASDAKVAKRRWLRHSKNILRFRSDLSSMVIALSASLTALNAIQLASLRQYEFYLRQLRKWTRTYIA